MTTTLNQIRKHNPCIGSWEDLLKSLNKLEADDEPLSLKYILDTLGIEDAIWTLQVFENIDQEIVAFAADCLPTEITLKNETVSSLAGIDGLWAIAWDAAYEAVTNFANAMDEFIGSPSWEDAANIERKKQTLLFIERFCKN